MSVEQRIWEELCGGSCLVRSLDPGPGPQPLELGWAVCWEGVSIA